jgi:colicin import membrane protein
MSEVTERPEPAAEQKSSATVIATVRQALPTILAADKGDILGKLADELKDYVPDGSTPQGRKEIGSKARKAGVARQDMIRLAKALKEDSQKIINGVNAEVRVINERFDGLIDWIEAPHLAYKAQEKARTDGHETALAEIEILAALIGEPTSQEIADRIARIPAITQRQWQEFQDRAERAIAITRERLEVAHAAAVKREAEAAELARLRAESLERQRVDNHKVALNLISNFATMAEMDPTAAQYRRQIDRLDAVWSRERDWEEFAGQASDAYQSVHDGLTALLVLAEEREAKEQAAREAEIAARAAEQARKDAEAEAERKRIAAEEQAKAEQEAAERRAEQARQEAALAEAQRKQAEVRAEEARKNGHKQALAAVQAKIEDALSEYNTADMIRRISQQFEAMPEIKRDYQEFQAEADDLIASGRRKIADRFDAVSAAEGTKFQQAEARRLAAEQQQREEAAAAERKRIEAEEEHQRQEEAKRAANLGHRRKINNEAVADLMAAGVSRTAAIEAVKAIALGNIRHVSIGY